MQNKESLGVGQRTERESTDPDGEVDEGVAREGRKGTEGKGRKGGM